MDEADLTKAADVVANKMAEGHTEEEAKEILRKVGYSEEDIGSIVTKAKTHPSAANLDAAFGPPVARPAPQPVQQPIYQQPVYAQPPPKSHKGLIIGVVVVLIIIIAATAFFLMNTSPSGESTDGESTSGESADGNTVVPNIPNTFPIPQPEEPEEPEGNVQIDPWTLETESFTLGIQTITLNDKKDSIDEVELLFEKDDRTDPMYATVEIWQNEKKITPYVYAATNYPEVYIELANTNSGIELTSRYLTFSTKVTGNYEKDLKTDCMVYRTDTILNSYDDYGQECGDYASGNLDDRGWSWYCGSFWKNCELSSGTYELRVRLYSRKSTGFDVEGMIKKEFVVGSTAPKIQ